MFSLDPGSAIKDNFYSLSETERLNEFVRDSKFLQKKQTKTTTVFS